MDRDKYIKTVTAISENEKLAKSVRYANSVLTVSVYVFYPLYLFYLVFFKREVLAVTITVPFISFVVISVIRAVLNSPRPYELYKIKPVINKETHGKSFPSRHVFSAFVIGTTVLYSNIILGVIVFAVGILIGFIRVIAGVHFIRDVLCGALFGIVFGTVGLAVYNFYF